MNAGLVLKQRLINYILNDGYTSSTTTRYLALFDGNPQEDGSGAAEITTTIRAAGRVAITFGGISGGQFENSAIIDFGNAANAGSIGGVAIYSAATGGDLLAFEGFTPLNVNQGDPVRVNIGDLIASSSGDLSGTYRDKLLQMLRGQNAGTPFASNEVALFNGNPTSGGTEVTSSVSAGGRETLPATNNNNGTFTSNAEVDFGQSANNVTITHMAIYDSAGNLVGFKSVGSHTVPTGKRVYFPVGNITLSVQ